MAFDEEGNIYLKLDPRGETNSHDRQWDDGAMGCVKEIMVWHDKHFISGIQIIYERRGAKLISKKHGGTQGNFEMISLKGPLTWVSGHYGSYCLDPELFVDEEEAPWNYYKVINSLKFGNEEETYGPFGLENGVPFFFRGSTAQIVGFHGFSSDATSGFGFLSAIGIYLKTEAVGVVGDSSSVSAYQVQSQNMIGGDGKPNLITGT